MDHVVARAFDQRADENWRAVLASRIGSARVLILLDGCEQVAAACGSLVEELLDACPNLRVLATSRQPLDAEGERVLPLATLRVPDESAPSTLASLLCAGAARLFAESASRASPELVLDGSEAAVGAICRSLGGFPLALELVAPLAETTGLHELASDLQREAAAPGTSASALPGIPPPVATAVNWRLAHLDPVQRRLVEALSGLPGGAGLETLIAVAGAPELHRSETAEALLSLAATSVVSVEVMDGAARYTLRDVLQRHVRDLLVEEGRFDRIGRRRLRFTLSKLSGGEKVLVSGPQQLRWMETLAREEGNWRAALAFALETGDTEAAASLCSELWRYFELSGQHVEGREILSRVLEADPSATTARSHLLDGMGMLAWRCGDYEAADAAFTEALMLADDGLSARLSNHLGLVALFAGHVDQAGRHFETALAGATRLDSPGEVALVQANLALLDIENGRPLEAKRKAGAALALQLALGDRHGQAVSRLHLSIADFFLGQHDSALCEAGEAAAIFTEFGDLRNLSFAFGVCSAALSAEGRSAMALELAGLQAELCRQTGVGLPPGWGERLEAALEPARRDLGPHAPAHEAVGARSDPSSVLALVLGDLDAPTDIPAHSLVVEALGDFRLLRAGRSVELSPQPARLVKLVVAAGRPLHVEEAIDALWPEAAPSTGRTRLRNTLSRLTRAAGRVIVREGESLRLAREVVVDAHRFERAARRALDMLAGGGDPAGALGEARAVIAMYRGDLLVDEPYEAWAHRSRECLRRLMLQLLEDAAEAALAAGEPDEGEALLRVALQMDPLDEARYMQLAQLLASLQRCTAAMQVIEQARAAAQEIGLPLAKPLSQLEYDLRHRQATAPAGRGS